MKPDLEIARESEDAAHRRGRGQADHSGRGAGAVRPPQGQGRLRFHQRAAGQAGRRAGAGDRHQSDPRGRGQDHHHGRPRRRAEPHRQARGDLPARAIARPELRHEGRRGRRRLFAGGADGPDQPAFHRRLPRDHLGQQPARRDDRQPHLLGQCAGHRRAAGVVAPLPGHERPGAALDRQQPGRRGERLPARGRVRHQRRVGSDGGVLPVARPGGTAGAAGQDDRGADARRQGGDGEGHQGRRRDGRAAEGRAGAQFGADAGRFSGVRAWRPVRQYRAWLQLGDGDAAGVEAGRRGGDGGRVRCRSGRGEVHRHQVPPGGADAVLRGGRGHGAGAEDAWRRGSLRAWQGRRRSGEARRCQPGAACREPGQVRAAGGGRA